MKRSAYYATLWLASTSFVAFVPCPTVALAQQTAKIIIDLPQQRLADSLRALALLSGRTVLADDGSVADRSAPALRGSFSLEEALRRLLAGSGLAARAVEGGYVVSQSPEARRESGTEANGEQAVSAPAGSEITVTGSRIRGAPLTSPVIAVAAAQMQEQGKTELGDVVRSIPQSFGGGQNPGVGSNVPTASGIDVGGASTVNLRGLGSDATLTLINGHRLAYNGSRQGVDISALPFAMVDRIEIVADGASALYGSDAVAGVANVILRRDYDGILASANLGTSTEGGDFRQQYGLTAGKRWASGGFVGSYEFARNSQILTNDRSFTASRPGNTLIPPTKRNAFAGAAHQDLTGSLTFEVDGQFNNRDSVLVQPNNTAGNLSVSRTEKVSQSKSFSIAPALKLSLEGGWRLALSGVYGTEDVHLASNSYVGSTQTGTIPLCYCNKGSSVELAGDGPLFALPGGPAKIAMGLGYRYNELFIDRGKGNYLTGHHSQDSYYAYGELSLPVISPEQAIGWIDRLNFSGALRFEHYPGVDDVLTPKIGMIFAPVHDLALKANWGKSFRAPTLYQQYLPQSVLYYNATSLGGTSGTALLLTGGNPDLKPERATSWTATVEYKPHQLPGLGLQVGYFSTRYADRIVTPITYFSQALSNTLYAPYVERNPSLASIQDLVANSATFYNATGAAFDASRVVAIANNTSVNAGNQRIRGIDVLADYVQDLGEGGGSLALSLNASYLHSTQTLIAGAAATQLAGTLFNPPHWRGRASATWSLDGFSLNTTVSRTGGVEDQRTAGTVDVSGQTLVDLTARYAFQQAHGPLRGLVLTLTLQNLLNDEPQTIATTSIYDTSFDTTNYSGIGRYIGFGVTKAW
jgi:outer membrane receptor protein involved in Fe transport